MPRSLSSPPLLSWRSIIILGIILLACATIIPQVHQLQIGFEQLIHAVPVYVCLALLSVCVAVTASGGTYTFLALKPVRLWHAVLVQIAGMFVNRLLPAGVGGLGLNARFLYTHKHTAPQAATVALMNNFLTGVGHATLFIAAVIMVSTTATNVHITGTQIMILVGVLAAIVLGFELWQHTSFTKRMRSFIKDMGKTIARYKHRKRYMAYAIICALINTSGHVCALFCVALAFDVHVSIATTVLILTGGVVAASVTPTPGGVVGAEAALAAGLIGFGVNSTDAIAIAVSYRIVSYWAPLIPGILALFYIQKKKLI